MLTRKMIGYLSGRGTRRMVAYVLRENASMQKLAHAHGMVLDAAGCDTDMLCFVLPLPVQ